METQVKVNGQVIILADTKPLYHHGYDQWRLVKTGDTWNVDGSRANVCYNADISEAQGEIDILSPTLITDNIIDCWRNGECTTHTIVDNIDDSLDENQILCWSSYDGSVFMIVFERGVGYVQSCGTAAVAVAKYTGKNIINCHGGQYTITRNGYTWKVKAKNVENSS